MSYPGRSPKLPREAAYSGNWLGIEQSFPIAREKSAEGIVVHGRDMHEGLNGSRKGSKERSSYSDDETAYGTRNTTSVALWYQGGVKRNLGM
jgi:hypothetical protein